MYIDIHTHAFHPKIAHKAVDHLNDFYSVNCAGDGTIAHLLERERKHLWWNAHTKSVIQLIAEGHWPDGIQTPDTNHWPF